METPTKIKELFQAIDSMDAEKFITFLAENASFKFGNAPAVTGREEIKKAVNGFFSSINGLSHKILNTWQHSETIICQGEATYTKKDESKLTVPFVNIFNMEDDLVKEYLIYVDVSPLFQ